MAKNHADSHVINIKDDVDVKDYDEVKQNEDSDEDDTSVNTQGVRSARGRSRWTPKRKVLAGIGATILGAAVGTGAYFIAKKVKDDNDDVKQFSTSDEKIEDHTDVVKNDIPPVSKAISPEDAAIAEVKKYAGKDERMSKNEWQNYCHVYSLPPADCNRWWANCNTDSDDEYWSYAEFWQFYQPGSFIEDCFT